MAYKPIVLGSGIPAWNLLQSTLSDQQRLHSAGFRSQSDTNYFIDRFSDLNSADDITSDRRILRVVLGAFGLSSDIDSRHFVRTIMNEGTLDSSALANRLTDRRYKDLATAFDFTMNPPSHKLRPGLRDQIVEDFRRQSFEEAVGDTSNDMRLALTFQRTLKNLAANAHTNSAAWFQLLATPPLREVIQTALGLPSAFGNLDIDEQRDRLTEKTNNIFGTSNISELSNSSLSDVIVRRFLVVQQTQQTASTSRFDVALTLLRAG